MKPRSWHFITGEYPPQPGGVSDYCRQIAAVLAEEGQDVHVWAPPSDRRQVVEDSVHVHRLQGRFGIRSLAELSRGIRRYPPPRRVFVQYVAGAFGWRAMNLAFCLWLWSHRPDPVWVMFHEYSYPLRRGLRPAHVLLGCVTSVMGAIVAARADRVFVSTPAWEPRIPSFVRRNTCITWLPVPSNLPLTPGENDVTNPRADIVHGKKAVLIGHFGTYGPAVAPLLMEILPLLLSRNPGTYCLLMGRNSREFLEGVIDRHPDLRTRLVAKGALPPAGMTAQLRECDIMLQPYPDGVTARRGSFMAGLSLGLPVITNAGESTEPIWFQTDAIVLARDPSPEAMVSAAEGFLSAPERWSEVGRQAADLYHREFSLARTLDIIRKAAAREE